MDDIVNLSGVQNTYKDERGGAALYTRPIIGIVKNNVDPLRSGRIEVYLKRMNSSDSDNPAGWTSVSYMSPFFGYTPNTGSPDSDGTYIGNPNSYGFWATPPDIGTEIVCIFINGDPNFGYYIGSIPKPGLTQMVPAMGSADSVIPNGGEANSYGGSRRLPVTEYNNANKKQDNSSTVTSSPRPVHSVQAAILNKQGLLRDPDRGSIGSTSMRESPSRVFGMSTPGRPIYEGGYDDSTVASATAFGKDSNFKVVGRTGGHTFVMDDGDISGRDQLVRLRTSQGHQIMMNDYAQTLFIIHANGQSYIELGKEGTIDIYSTNSVNIRTQGDLNLHADNNININAAKDFNLSAKNINIESLEATSQLVGSTFKQQTKANHTLKVDGSMSFASAGDSSLRSTGASVFVNGAPNVLLNTGSSPLTPEDVIKLPIVAHTDTLYDEAKGYASAPAKLSSITSRAPAHSPWANANQGVDVKTNLSAAANLPAAPPAAVTQTNEAATGSPVNPTKPSVAATVPTTPASAKVAVSDVKGTASSLVSQMAVNVAGGPAAAAIAASAGVVDINGAKIAAVGILAMNPAQMCAAGTLKPGADVLINKMIQDGKSVSQALATNLFTGKDGISSVKSFVSSVPAQAGAANELLQKSAEGLTKAGVITGGESATQIGGLLLSGASAGLGPTLDLVKNSSLANVAGTAGLSSAIASLPTAANPLAASAKSLVASGNFAANLADKTMGPLAGVTATTESLRGLAASAFAKVTSVFKALKGNVPQSLSVAIAKNKEEAAAAAATATTTPVVAPPNLTPESVAAFDLNKTLTSTFGSKLSGLNSMQAGFATSLSGAGVDLATGRIASVDAAFASGGAGAAATALADTASGIPGLPGIPGGMSAVSNLVNAAPGALNKIPGTGSISSAVGNISSGVSGSLSSVKSAISGAFSSLGGKGNLASLASTGLNPAAAAELQGALASLGSAGPVKVKVPTIAVDSFDFGPIAAQSAALLGNPKIPPLNFGASKVPSQSADFAADTKEYDRIKAELVKQEDLQWELRKTWLDAQKDFGQASPKAIEANDKYKETLRKINELRTELSVVAQRLI